MKKIIQVGVEIILVTLAVVITGQVYLNVNLIPKFIFSYQEGIFSNSELFTILLVYVIVGFSILFISKFIKF